MIVQDTPVDKNQFDVASIVALHLRNKNDVMHHAFSYDITIHSSGFVTATDANLNSRHLSKQESWDAFQSFQRDSALPAKVMLMPRAIQRVRLPMNYIDSWNRVN